MSAQFCSGGPDCLNTSKKDVILVLPNFIPGTHKPKLYTKREALGIGYLFSSVIKHGLTGDVLNAQFENLDFKQTVEKITSDSYLVTGISVPSQRILKRALAIAETLQKEAYDTHVCFGGHFPSIAHNLLLERYSFIDSVVRGEGEGVLIKLIKRIKSGMPLDDVSGLSFRKNHTGDLFLSPKINLIPNLDDLPYPYRFSLSNPLKRAIKWTFIPMLSSRGCHCRCSFCTTTSPRMRVWRPRDPNCVIGELDHLWKDYGVKKVMFYDDDFLGHSIEGKKHALEICDELIKRELGITFRMQCRIDEVEEYLFEELCKAGLKRVSIGVENFVPRVLKFYRKGYSLEAITRSLRILETFARRFDLGIKLYLILFDPFTKIQQLKQNLRYIKRYLSFFVYSYDKLFVSKLIPYYGAEVTKDLISAGIASKVSPFSYDYAFLDPQTALAWSILNSHKRIMDKTVGNIRGFEASRVTRLVEKNPQASEKQIEEALSDLDFKLLDLKRQVLNCWLEIFERTLTQAEEGTGTSIYPRTPERIKRVLASVNDELEGLRKDLD